MKTSSFPREKQVSLEKWLSCNAVPIGFMLQVAKHVNNSS
ncbi:hypothetical protein SOVF_079730 [Spinacia oleracea]|nr:hypothetical protein SOVF_079730 [Spinacia oleracea]